MKTCNIGPTELKYFSSIFSSRWRLEGTELNNVREFLFSEKPSSLWDIFLTLREKEKRLICLDMDRRIDVIVHIRC